jgi:flagellar FliL protein
MADEDVVFGDEDVTGGVEPDSGGRGGFLPEIVIKILKLVAMGLAAIIFIVTVVVITMQILGRGGAQQSLPAVSREYQGVAPILQWWDGIDEIRTRTSDTEPMTVIVKVKIGFEKDNKTILTELNDRQSPLQAEIRHYFSTKNAAELTPRHEAQITNELKTLVNDRLTGPNIERVIIMDLQILDF